MGNKYERLHDEGEESDLPPTKEAHIAITMAKKASPIVTAGIDTALDTVIGPTGAAVGLASGASTWAHMTNLQALLDKITATDDSQALIGCTCKNCEEILKYLIGQKKSKLSNIAVGAVPVVGTANTIKRAAKGMVKRFNGTQGNVRFAFATLLWRSAIGIETANGEKCLMARNIISELCGEAKLSTILLNEKGVETIAEKMSTG